MVTVGTLTSRTYEGWFMSEGVQGDSSFRWNMRLFSGIETTRQAGLQRAPWSSYVIANRVGGGHELLACD